MSALWHYLVRAHLQSVLASGTLTPRKTSADKAERPAIWFSTHQDWEPMAHPPIMCQDGSTRPATRELLHTIGAGPVRIGVDAAMAPHSWHEFKAISNISAKHASDIQSLAVGVHSKTSWWRFALDAIPRSQWLSVEQYNGWEWQPIIL